MTAIKIKETFRRGRQEWAVIVGGRTIAFYDDKRLAILLKAISNNPELYCSLC